MTQPTVVIRGGGDLGSGVALRLWRAGCRVILLETEHPIAVRRTVSFAEAVYDGCATVEEAEGRLLTLNEVLHDEWGSWDIPVVVDPSAASIESLRPIAVIDAILAKRNIGTERGWAPLVVGLGPGFHAPANVHAVVETNRGPHLGRVIWNGEAQPNTGEPAPVSGIGRERVLRAPATGVLRIVNDIGTIVNKGEVVATVRGVPVRAGFRSLVRGLARDGLHVDEGMKIGDIDPRLDPALCRLVSDKSLAIAGGVLEAVMMALRGTRSV